MTVAPHLFREKWTRTPSAVVRRKEGENKSENNEQRARPRGIVCVIAAICASAGMDAVDASRFRLINAFECWARLDFPIASRLITRWRHKSPGYFRSNRTSQTDINCESTIFRPPLRHFTQYDGIVQENCKFYVFCNSIEREGERNLHAYSLLLCVDKSKSEFLKKRTRCWFLRN